MKKFFWAAGMTLAFAFVTACAPAGERLQPAQTAGPGFATGVAAGDAAKKVEPDSSRLQFDDVKLNAKIKDKECFEGWGCNITYEVQASWAIGKVKPGEAYEVTYEVSGPKDGAQIGTLTIGDSDRYTTNEDFTTTKSKSVTLKPKVTAIERLP